MKTLFEGDESTARPIGSMIVQKLVFFTHSSKDGDEPVHKTLNRVKVSLKNGQKPEKVRDMSGYYFDLDDSGLPQDNGKPKIKVETLEDSWSAETIQEETNAA